MHTESVVTKNGDYVRVWTDQAQGWPPVLVLLSPSSPFSPHDRPVNPRDEVLRQGIQLYSESWLTEKMADWSLRVIILSGSGCQVLSPSQGERINEELKLKGRIEEER